MMWICSWLTELRKRIRDQGRSKWECSMEFRDPAWPRPMHVYRLKSQACMLIGRFRFELKQFFYHGIYGGVSSFVFIFRVGALNNTSTYYWQFNIECGVYADPQDVCGLCLCVYSSTVNKYHVTSLWSCRTVMPLSNQHCHDIARMCTHTKTFITQLPCVW